MGATTANAAYMYDEVEEIRNLNKVEGFDPRRYMRIIGQEGQAGKYYLDVAFRKLWFRLKYPEGKIVKKILKLTDQVAIVEARVYLHRNDSEENFIANALAQKYRTEDGQFGNKFVELAETAAVGRALSDAGFGLQFADKEEDIDKYVEIVNKFPNVIKYELLGYHTMGVFKYNELGIKYRLDGVEPLSVTRLKELQNYANSKLTI